MVLAYASLSIFLMKWRKMVAGDDADLNNIYFVQVTLDESTGEMFCSKLFSGLRLEG